MKGSGGSSSGGGLPIVGGLPVVGPILGGGSGGSSSNGGYTPGNPSPSLPGQSGGSQPSLPGTGGGSQPSLPGTGGGLPGLPLPGTGGNGYKPAAPAPGSNPPPSPIDILPVTPPTVNVGANGGTSAPNTGYNANLSAKTTRDAAPTLDSLIKLCDSLAAKHPQMSQGCAFLAKAAQSPATAAAPPSDKELKELQSILNAIAKAFSEET